MADAGESQSLGVKRLVRIGELSRILGLSDTMLTKNALDGMPRERDPQDARCWLYNPEACLEWRRNHAKRRRGAALDRLAIEDAARYNGYTPNGSIPPLRESEEKIAHYKAQMAELDLAVKRGQYLEASDVDVEWTRRLTRMERMLMSRDRRLAPRICLALGVGPDKAHVVRELLAADIAEAVAKAANEGDGEDAE